MVSRTGGSGARGAGGRRVKTGVALSMTEVRAADLRLRGAADGGWRAALDPPEPGAASWPSLAAALRELADLLGVEKGGGGGGGQLVVALMPPLTEVRRLDLPPLRDDELHRLLSRNASRYFLNAREAQIVGTATGRRRGRGAVGPDPIVGAAASARLIAAIENAARDAGWTIDAIVPAEAGWRTAAVTLWPAFNKGVSHLLVHHGDRTDVLRLEEGRLAGVRRFRGGAADADLITELVSQSRDNGTAPRVAAIGTRALRDDLTRVLTGRGAIISAPPGDWTNGVDDAALVAASFAVAHEELALRTEAALVARAQRSRFATVYVAAAAVVLLAAAAWTELWGVRRELAAVQAKRDQIKPRLETTLVGRASVEAAHSKLAELLEAERTAPHWAPVIGTVTDHLDQDAYLVALRARGDTLLLEGRAVSAAPIADAMADIPGLANVRSAGQVQRDVQRDGEALDRFTIAAQLIPPPKPREVAPPRVPPKRGAIR